jgi:putative Mg2+ transporter-C (MgtC) family protein
MSIDLFDLIVRMSTAAGLAGVIGLERQVAQKAAGLRTHMLVGLGAGVFAFLSVESFPGSDPARVAAQIVTGVGFLGAGAIFRHGVSVRGLTTAAGMWTAAAVGLASGLGEYEIALVATGVAVVVLYVVGVVQWMLRGREDEATVHLRARLDPTADVEEVCTVARDLVEPAGGVSIDEVGVDHSTIIVSTTPAAADHALAQLARHPGVIRVTRSRP